MVQDGQNHTRKEGGREIGKDRDRVKYLLASGVPPKGLEAHALTFGGTEGSMLGKRGWFDAFSKGMVRFQIEGNGLMLDQRG